ncbi:glycosyltransferase [Proteus mirabilis]|nr:glycosyltransferase [Proteus mirabilis]MBI6308917.1 glycosyltransferase [Proteus mirabilis]MBI6522074.1 glycosyltransferase [Proteus mirabilis]SPY37843.1 glycosyl transferase family protein [Proteus mirabilis]
MPNVAIIMSIYANDILSQVKEAIDSIFSQNYNNIRIFICIDGEINQDIMNYLNSLKKIFLIKRDKNKGLAISLNELIECVLKEDRFKYIARMDADDISMPDRIQKQVQYLEKNLDISVLGTKCKEFGSIHAREYCSVYESNNDIYKYIFKKCPFVHPSVMFRTEVFKSGIRYPTNEPFTEDLALWFILAMKKYKFSNLNECLLKFRINDQTVSRRRGYKKAIIEFKIRLKYLILLKRINNIHDIYYTLGHFFVRLLPTPLFKRIYIKG